MHSHQTKQMPFTLSFHSLTEKVPQHNEHILYFNTTTDGFDFQQGNLREDTVEYIWDEIDEDGMASGNSACYNEGDLPEDNWKLSVGISNESYGFIGEGETLEPRANNIYWINAEEFWNTFPEPVYNY